MSETRTKLKGEHCLHIHMSYQLKEKIIRLAEKYDRTIADMVRTLITVSIPLMEELTEAEEGILRDYITKARKLRKVRQMKIEEEGYEDNKLKTEI
jgi:predicted DNA-binding protein